MLVDTHQPCQEPIWSDGSSLKKPWWDLPTHGGVMGSHYTASKAQNGEAVPHHPQRQSWVLAAFFELNYSRAPYSRQPSPTAERGQRGPGGRRYNHPCKDRRELWRCANRRQNEPCPGWDWEMRWFRVTAGTCWCCREPLAASGLLGEREALFAHGTEFTWNY